MLTTEAPVSMNPSRLKRVMKKMLQHVVSWFPPEKLDGLLYRIAAARAATLSPAESLRFLFRLDKNLYTLHGRQAIRYGNGVHTKHRHLKFHDFFVQRVESGWRVLDIGSGIGSLAHDLAVEANANVVGIDINAAAVSEARKRFAHPNLEFHVYDALKQIPGGHFDVIVLSKVLEHLPGRSDLLRKLARATGASSILIRVPLFEREWRVPLKKELGVEWRLDSTHFTEYTTDSFAEEIRAADLTISHQEVHWGELWAEIGCRP